MRAKLIREKLNYYRQYYKFLREEKNSSKHYGELEKDFVFLHIPKAGGSSLRRFFGTVFGQSKIFPEPQLKKVALSSVTNGKIPQVFMRHFGYNQLPDTPCFTATVLRHPVERLLSVYSYAMNPGKHPPLIGGVKPNMNLLEFLSSQNPGIQMNINNAQTWQLGYGYLARERKVFASDGNILQCAKDNVVAIDFPGVLEQVERFRERIGDAFEVEVESAPELINKSVQRLQFSDLSPRERKAVEAFTELDIELYDFVCKRL